MSVGPRQGAECGLTTPAACIPISPRQVTTSKLSVSFQHGLPDLAGWVLFSLSLMKRTEEIIVLYQ